MDIQKSDLYSATSSSRDATPLSVTPHSCPRCVLGERPSPGTRILTAPCLHAYLSIMLVRIAWTSHGAGTS
jgi:hypothetical protein